MSKIEWTDRSDWNAIRGCTRISDGCVNCYAEAIAARFSGPGEPFHSFATRTPGGSRWTGKVALIEERLMLPLRWRKPARVFVNSAFDLFHEAVPDDWIDMVFAVMALAPQHTFQVLTKRSKRMREWASDERDRMIARKCVDLWLDRKTTPGDDWPVETVGDIDRPDDLKLRAWPLPNVWLGVSAERQQEADERVPDLLVTPAAKRFVSAEPLLGPIDFTNINPPDNGYGGRAHGVDALSKHNRVLRGVLDWVIAGGESGPNARPMHPDWARAIRDQCAGANVPFFFKQHGEWETVFDRDRDDPDWRRCGRVLHATPDGQWLNLAGGQGFHGDRVVRVNRVGKRRAGRLLDGVEHKAWPEAAQ